MGQSVDVVVIPDSLDACSIKSSFHPTALRKAKTQQSFGHSECNRNKLGRC